jgi:amino acid adenylation domain-containing protein
MVPNATRALPFAINVGSAFGPNFWVQIVHPFDHPSVSIPVLLPRQTSRTLARHEDSAELVHRVVERHAEAAPEEVALRFKDDTLTYSQLNRAANQVAHYLVAAGVGAESRVVVCVEPSFDVVVSLLAILKAGGVYVPVDPTYPIARIRTILDDTCPTLIITHSRWTDRLVRDDTSTLALDRAAPLLEAMRSDNPKAVIDPERTAFIYYTSGTTGTPKGAMGSYANLASYIHVAQKQYRFTRLDVMPAIARFSFSISMFELLLPLVAGGTVVLLERDHILDLGRMSRTLSEVTFFHAGPALLKNLLSYVERHYSDVDAFSHVRHASSGGDMVPPEILEGLRRIFSNAEVFVIYGCTEISCMGCTYPVAPVGSVIRACVGAPFDGVIVRLLDASLNPVSRGIEGEIAIAGPGVVKGYLNRPELTAERFVVMDGDRFYRTGDMGRMRADGSLELLGRVDFQVKIRGMRVELPEVEYHLRRAPGVQDGVVTATIVEGEKVMVAYVVVEQDDPDPWASRMPRIRQHMAERLPEFMVPSSYVKLPRLPLNMNMKVDRHALPEPEPESLPRGASIGRREPTTSTERRLASLWKKVLAVGEVALDDNFFELGGDSLLALKLILAIDEEFGVVLQGMEVLRESFEVQARLCDRRSGNAELTPHVLRTGLSEDEIELFHFGEDRSLYGVFHEPRVGLTGGDAVLICPPVGQEQVRTHFVLQRLARQLAAKGVPVLRFDYYGCGDSSGDSIAATCGRWQRDIAEAYVELRRRTPAARITAVGVRLGATLLCNAASRFDTGKVVLWDPIYRGCEYRAEAEQGQRRYMRSLTPLRLRMPGRRDAPGCELLGLRYSHRALDELNALVIPTFEARRSMAVRWLATGGGQGQNEWFRSACGDRHGCRIDILDFDCAWHDVTHIEDVLPDTGISKKLAEMVMDAA